MAEIKLEARKGRRCLKKGRGKGGRVVCRRWSK